ncbi:MAG: GNAT family N-acetyltransferase [Flavobacteriales bacterium]|nr:GNAT family N-acetyltransferase [Flavobacteriales bacterium]
MPTTIRSARTHDLSELVRLCVEHAAYERTAFDPAGKEEALHRMLFDPGARLVCLVAESDGVVVGYATYSVECSTWDADHYMHMDCLFLRPEARNKGIGRQLMKTIAQEGLAQGVVRMQWQTPSFNVDAVRFYDRLGPVKKEKFRMFLGEEETRTLAMS